MNENLMVNSKTDILEFKRKHNLLVGKGTIKTTVSNIKQLTNADIENLSCGDVVLKEDSSGKHAYLVSFKSDTGLCLTYCDASCVETQSYDKVGDNWQYNSEDKWEMTKRIYFHPILIRDNTNFSRLTFVILDNNPNAYTPTTFKQKVKELMEQGAIIQVNGCFVKADTCFMAYTMSKASENIYRIYGNTYLGAQGDLDLDTQLTISQLDDGVNSIN